ncbi:hypothetical protein JTB14_024840 [Gonioctena quinquepunctata]|nr:hypothetical protein JTB14_024840 [Gonioctena quinquepunctata]
MWSQYDENLYLNPFFKFIQRNHNDLLERASIENWILCIPRHGTLESYDFTTDIILDHILIPGNEEEENIHYTLSKKQVNVQNGHITTNNSSEDYPNGIEISFEETFYIEKTAKYKDCIDFLWCECSGHHVLDSIKHLVAEFIQEHKEIEVEDLQTQKELIDDPQNCNEIGQNLLLLASISGNSEVVEYLLNQNFDVDVTDYFGKTSLHYAANRGYLNIVLLLMNRQANVNIKDNEKNTPLHLACTNGQENCVRALIYSSREVELNIGNYSGETPLHLATIWGYYEIIKILLENGATPGIKNRRNQTVSDLAPNYYILKLVEKFGMKQNKTVKENTNEPVTLQVVDNQQKYCNDLGECPNHITQSRKIAHLLKAIEYNDFPLARFYLGFCSDSKTSEIGNCHPLCVCEKCQKSEDEINDFQKYEAININMCDITGHTPLHVAAKFGRPEILRLILDSGASVNVQTYNDLYTPLHLACIFQHTQIVQELVKCGNSKIDKQDFKGNTALHHACAANDLKIVRILLDNGANGRKKNFLGKSPLQESEENMQYRVSKLMRTNLDNIAKISDTS